MDRRIDQIRRADVIAILSPVMAEKRATGSKLHGWIRGALAWGVAREHIEFNVADGIGAALPSGRATRRSSTWSTPWSGGGTWRMYPASPAGAAIESCAQPPVRGRNGLIPFPTSR